MSEDLTQRIAANLRRYLAESGKNQTDLAEALQVSTSTTSDWMGGKKTPRMDRIEQIAEYLGVRTSQLFEDPSEQDAYHTNPETARIAQEIYEDDELRALFAEARDAEPEELRMLHSILKEFKRREKGEYDQRQF